MNMALLNTAKYTPIQEDGILGEVGVDTPDVPPEYQSERLLDKYGDEEARARFVTVIPPEFELFWKQFDDTLIALIQYPHQTRFARLVSFMAFAFTGMLFVDFVRV